MMYLLMNKDNIVATFKYTTNNMISGYKLFDTVGKLPYGFETIDGWLESRQAAKHRRHIKKLMEECGCSTTEGFIRVLHCTGINDTFWVKREDESVTWKDVSLYTNEFDDMVTRIAFEGAGLYGMQFSSTSPEFSLEGSYEKCCIRENGKLFLIKRGTTGYANAGKEPYSEYFSYPLYEYIVGDVVPYELVKFRGVIASKCKLFSDENFGFIPISKIVRDVNSLVALSEYYDSIGSLDKFKAMLVADAVCFNNDRHGGNHGVLVNNDTQEIITMAPIFDHNVTLLPYIMESDYDTIDNYISEQSPRIGDSWISVARRVLTPELRSRLVSLKGYEIPWEGDDLFDKRRVEFISKLINRQIEEILK